MSTGTKYWRVSPRIWLKHHWTEDMKLLALYLLTCEHRTTEGLFRLPKQYVSADLQWDMERLGKAFGQLLEEDFIEYDDDAQVILLCNALKYQRPDNTNQQKAAIRALRELPETSLWPKFQALAKALAEPFYKALVKEFGKAIPDSPAPTPSPTLALTRRQTTSAREEATAGAKEAAVGVDEQSLSSSETPERVWQEITGQVINPTQAESLRAAFDDGFESDVLAWAMKRARVEGKGFSYFLGIVKNLRDDQCFTMSQLEVREQQRTERRRGKSRADPTFAVSDEQISEYAEVIGR